jgi:class 3 adenylate cyclase
MNYEEEGVLFRLDISGYGQLCEYVRGNMGSFKESGKVVEQWLNGALYRHFWEQLAKCGVTRVRMEGDGFVAVQPMADRDPSWRVQAVLNFLSVFRDISDVLEQFNIAVRDTGKRVTCRCALHQGTYRYGRIGQLLASGGELEGSAITEVTRLDQALRDKRMAAASVSPVAAKPTLVMSASLFKTVSSRLPDLQGCVVEQSVAVVKEFESEVVFFTYPPATSVREPATA